ncbi:MAG: tetratricopeptide repeat protein [Lewinellaceae bacterium]|nr:tetratricopeptide repeat protein [Lewinellaceae bacterium]
MKTIVALLLLPFLALAQEKGVVPSSSGQSTGIGTTRALVVGISDYQDPAIPDLRFADKDAEAFAGYLQSPSGGSVPEDHIILLTNERATNARMADALIWLLESSKPGDLAIIYFSGHGDVETITRFNRGYLLNYDSPPKIYMAGAFNIRDLQDIISTMSNNKVQVLMISDACHVGKLAGADVGGTEATAQNLSQQFANEIKILSCQPNEFSLEGEQWGGGRGAFSYNLLDGLYGLADKNGNAEVNLFEIGRYLEDRVPEETAPSNQMPFTVGDRNAVIARVDAPSLARLQSEKKNSQAVFARIDSKGMEQQLLARADSSVQELYAAFNRAIAAKQLLEPSGTCAYDIYQKLLKVPDIEELQNLMRRNLSVALQGDAQQAVNAYLAGSPEELQRRYENEQDYSRYPRYLEKACELLGPDHFYYKNLMAKRYYFEGLGMRLDAQHLQKNASYEKAIEKQKLALKYQESAPFILNELGVLHTLLKKDDNAFEYYDKAIELAPQWALPYANYAVSLYYTGEIDKAIEYGQKAGALAAGNFPQIYSFLAWIYANNWSWKDKRNWERTATELQDNYQFEMNNTENTAQRRQRFTTSIKLLHIAEAMDSSNTSVLFNLGWLYEQIGKRWLAVSYYRKVTETDPLNKWALISLGRALGDTKESEQCYLKVLFIDSTNAIAYSYLGRLYSSLGKPDQAIYFYRIGLSLNNWTTYIGLAEQYIVKNLLQTGETYLLKGILYNLGDNHPVHFLRLGDLYREYLKRYDVAADMYEMALELKPDYVLALKNLAEVRIEMGQHDKILPIIKQLEKLAADNVYLNFDLAKIYLQAGDKPKAIQLLKDQVADNTVDPDFLSNAAWDYQYAYASYDEAERLFFRSLQLNGDTGACYAGLVYTYLRDGKPEKSWKYFQKLINRDSTAWNCYHIASYYAVLGEMEPALVWLEKSLQKGYTGIRSMQFDKDFIELRETPGYQRLVRKYFPEVFTDGGQFNPIIKEVYYPDNCVLLARIYEYKLQWQKAKEMYLKAISLRPEHLSDAENLALAKAYLKLGQADSARVVCPEKIESEDDNDLLEAGKLFYMLGKSEAAEMQFNKFTETVEKHDGFWKVGNFYSSRGEFTSSESYLKKAIEYNPESVASRRVLARLYFFTGKKKRHLPCFRRPLP